MIPAVKYDTDTALFLARLCFQHFTPPLVKF
jgi:hypothetical protein